MKIFSNNLILAIGNKIILLLLLILSFEGIGQENTIIQYSGIVSSSSTDQPIPYVGVGILRTRHGTYTDDKGFFSLVAETGDTILFSSLGYKSKRIILPQQLKSDSYYEKVKLEADTFQLESAIVYSIPSREHFKPEFLEMDVSDKMKEVAQQNIAAEVLARIEPNTPSDGRAGVSLYLAQEAQKAYYDGQFKPQRIFDPLAWVEFIKALKRGDFKKKR